MTSAAPANLLTIDVEDYFHATGLGGTLTRDRWDELPGRVEYSTRRLLRVLDRHDARATFFFLGWVAHRYPGLVREVQSLGHEIASHGWDHELVYRMTPTQFEQDVLRAKHTLEDLTGDPVLGYRAPSFSIVKESWWALGVLARNGYRYDSSVYPIRRERYGVPDAPREVHLVLEPNQEHEGLIEVPPPVVRLFRRNIPVAGGGYFRAFPMWFTEWAIRRTNEVEQRPMVVYLHPWELDPDQPTMAATPANQLRHRIGLRHTEARLERLLENFEFSYRPRRPGAWSVRPLSHYHSRRRGAGLKAPSRSRRYPGARIAVHRACRAIPCRQRSAGAHRRSPFRRHRWTGGA